MAAKKPQRDIEWATKLSDGALSCRTLRHQWEITSFDYLEDSEYTGKRNDRRAEIIQRTLICERCSTVRKDFFEKTASKFDRLRSRYDYPKGYKFVTSEHTAEKPTMEDLNLVLYKRYWGEQTVG